jgi:hypothetical protein
VRKRHSQEGYPIPYCTYCIKLHCTYCIIPRCNILYYTTLYVLSSSLLRFVTYGSISYSTVPDGDRWGSTAGPHTEPAPLPLALLLPLDAAEGVGVSAVTVTAVVTVVARVGD